MAARFKPSPFLIVASLLGTVSAIGIAAQMWLWYLSEPDGPSKPAHVSIAQQPRVPIGVSNRND